MTAYGSKTMDYAEWSATSAEDRLKFTDFIVEATSFEHSALWAAWHKHISWDQCNPGTLVTVGKLNDHPVAISLYWDVIGGKLICFYHDTSLIVDHGQIEEWFKKHFKGRWDHGFRRAQCDAMNFHLCMAHVTNDNIPQSYLDAVEASW